MTDPPAAATGARRPARHADDPKLDRELVLGTARRVVARDGLDALSIRSVAGELGVTPMALYRHVRNKDEILAVVVDDLLVAVDLPLVRDGDWRAWLSEIAASLRRLLQQHPVALQLFFRRPVTTPAARRRLQATTEVLTTSGFDEEQAIRAYAAVHTYTIGFSALEEARRSVDAPAPIDGEGDPGSDLIRRFVSDDQFEHGLRALISGLDPVS